MSGFCPHARAIPGLDAYYCPDCKKSILEGTEAYRLLRERYQLNNGATDKEKAEIARRRGESSYENGNNARIRQLEAENQKLKQINADLTSALEETATALKRAKNPDPVERPTLWRVTQLARSALMKITRVKGGWVLSMGEKAQRRFRRLKDIWELLSQSDWNLGDIFPQCNSDNYIDGQYVPPRAQVRPKLPQRHGSLAPAPDNSLSRGNYGSVIGAIAQLVYGYQPPWAAKLTGA